MPMQPSPSAETCGPFLPSSLKSIFPPSLRFSCSDVLDLTNGTVLAKKLRKRLFRLLSSHTLNSLFGLVACAHTGRAANAGPIPDGLCSHNLDGWPQTSYDRASAGQSAKGAVAHRHAHRSIK